MQSKLCLGIWVTQFFPDLVQFVSLKMAQFSAIFEDKFELGKIFTCVMVKIGASWDWGNSANIDYLVTYHWFAHVSFPQKLTQNNQIQLSCNLKILQAITLSSYCVLIVCTLQNCAFLSKHDHVTGTVRHAHDHACLVKSKHLPCSPKFTIVSKHV